MSNPSNAAIMKAIGELQGSMEAQFKAVKDEVVAVREQATKTNGRVTTIENWKNALEAVEKYKKDNQPSIGHADNVTIKPSIFQDKQFWGAVIAVLLAVAALINSFAGKHA